uniref:Protein kinase domain-containing protein n=1 Tax=Chenopodium quinoa TaxID=63459 RepID=A0A803LP60_CHEQI
MTNLVKFNASLFELPGRIPEWFGFRLGSLQVLDLHSCSINGSIPLSLGRLSRLTTLDLSSNHLSGVVPSTLGQLVNLNILDLSHNSLNGSIPDSFSSLRNLSFLDMSSNSLSRPIPRGIGVLQNLRTLNLSNNSLMSVIPPQLGDLRGLVDLDLSFNSLVNSLPVEFRGMRRLRKMVLGNNKLSGSLPDDLFPALTRLEIVDLSHNNFTGVVPDELWSISALRLVDISGNTFTGILPNITLSRNATAAVLNLSNNEFYGGLNLVLQTFSSIDISGNYFEGKLPEYVDDGASVRANCLQQATGQRTEEECSSFYASKDLVFDNFGHPSSDVTPGAGQVPKKKSHKRTIILAAVLGGIGLLLLLLLLLILFICTRRRHGTRQRGNGVGPIPPTGTVPPSPGVAINFSSLGESFTYQQLVDATSNFSDLNLIKNGHSGDLYRGLLEGGISVVVKKINLNSVKRESYLVELDFFSKITHPRLVPLLGYCLDQENEKYLVYKYMPNADLSSSLFRKVNTDDTLQSLDWITRLKIAIGVAEGLCYLHHECTPPFVHRQSCLCTGEYIINLLHTVTSFTLSSLRDIQASSILLDDKFEVRLGSLNDVCIQEGDSHPGVITRLLRLPQTSEQGPSGAQTSTCAYDIYCFGKVLLELVTGKLGISSSNDTSMKEWMDQTLPCINMYDKELVTKIVDPSLIYDEDLLEEVWAMAIVARSCLNPKPSRRPLMRYILRALENPLKVVREENIGSGRLRTTSSRGSWNASVFGSWRQSLDVGAAPPAPRVEGTGSLKRSGTSGSQGSGQVGGNDNSSSQRRQSREIFPEPVDVHDIERPETR